MSLQMKAVLPSILSVGPSEGICRIINPARQLHPYVS